MLDKEMTIEYVFALTFAQTATVICLYSFKPIFAQGRTIMATIEHKGKAYEVDEDGFLLNGSESWDQDWVDYVKSVEGIGELTEEHQKVIDALQEYYKKNGIAPMVRILSKTTGFPLKRIYELFPSGPGKGACKMAGLPKPTGCV